MTKPFRPLLAATIEDESQLSLLQYPLIGSPKLDGMRVLVHPSFGPCSRTLKPVANTYIRELLNKPEFSGLDGEITIGPNHGEGVFARTISATMSEGGRPQFTYWTFDHFTHWDMPYVSRLAHLETFFPNVLPLNGYVQISRLEWKKLESPAEVIQYERECLERGFEGIILRHRGGPYKFGRSTFPQQIMLKLKRFEDAEATIIGFEPLLRNTNEAQRDALGLQKRSSHKAGKIADDTLGKLLVSSPPWQDFAIGSGFDDALRDKIWQERDSYLGERITFKFQRVGSIDKPRIPIFKGFRPPE